MHIIQSLIWLIFAPKTDGELLQAALICLHGPDHPDRKAAEAHTIRLHQGIGSYFSGGFKTSQTLRENVAENSGHIIR